MWNSKSTFIIQYEGFSMFENFHRHYRHLFSPYRNRLSPGIETLQNEHHFYLEHHYFVGDTTMLVLLDDRHNIFFIEVRTL